MSKANLILEALFTGADEDECKRRDEIAPKIILQEWMEEFLKRDGIKKLPDGSYDVKGDVDLDELNLLKFPVKFNKVNGNFWCYNNNFTTLEGAPKTVGGSFWCYNNQLTTLEGAPLTVGGSFICTNNHLTDLNGGPRIVNRDFSCDHNNLTSLEGAPKTVGGDFGCYSQNEKEFTRADVIAVSEVKGVISV